MTHASTLAEHVDNLEIPDELDRDWFTSSFLVSCGIDPHSDVADLCEDVLLASVLGDDAAFHLRPGGWRVNVAGTAVKALLTGALLGAALFHYGATDIPAELLPAVIPLVVDVNRVRLSRRERELLVPLRIASAGLGEMAVSPHVLYNRLEPSVRAELTFGDFADFCDRLIAAGHLDDAGLGDVRTRPGGRPAWIRVTWT